jgi:hypothetical protein
VSALISYYYFSIKVVFLSIHTSYSLTAVTIHYSGNEALLMGERLYLLCRGIRKEIMKYHNSKDSVITSYIFSGVYIKETKKNIVS